MILCVFFARVWAFFVFFLFLLLFLLLSGGKTRTSIKLVHVSKNGYVFRITVLLKLFLVIIVSVFVCFFKFLLFCVSLGSA